MGLKRTFIKKTFLDAKLGPDGADAILDDVSAILAPGAMSPLDAQTLGQAIEALSAFRCALAGGLWIVRPPSGAAKGLAFIADPAVRADAALMAKLESYGAWELHDVR